MDNKISNADRHPEAWDFCVKQARNISETELSHLGNYSIPVPDESGEFIYSENVESLWFTFIKTWYTIESLKAPTVRGKIQYITNNLNH